MKLFILLPRVPYPTEKGDKLRAFNQLKQLSKRFEVTLCALNDSALHEDAVEVLSAYAKNVYIIPVPRLTVYSNLIRTIFSGLPLQVGYFYNKRIASIIRSLIDQVKPDHIFCQLIRVAEYVRGIPVPKTLDYQDVFSKNIERRLASSPFYMKPFLKMEYSRLLRYEHEVFGLFNNKIIISKPDRDLIPHPDREKIIVVKNGVDTAFFKPIEREKEYDLVFTGNMGYPPNINAAEFLVNKIFPLVRMKRNDLCILIAGANPHLRVSVLKSSQVEVSGWVRDMRECYARARIFIAPMQLGTGLQNKLLEAMAMKIPCITSPLANQALQAKENEEILIAETPQDYARHVLHLLEKPGEAKKIAENGYQYILRDYSWEKETQKIIDLIEK